MMGKVIHVHERYSLHFIISCQKTMLARPFFFSRPQSLKACSSWPGAPPKTHIVAPYEIRLCKCRLPEHEIIRWPSFLLLRRFPVGQKEYLVELPLIGTDLKA